MTNDNNNDNSENAYHTVWYVAIQYDTPSRLTYVYTPDTVYHMFNYTFQQACVALLKITPPKVVRNGNVVQAKRYVIDITGQDINGVSRVNFDDDLTIFRAITP